MDLLDVWTRRLFSEPADVWLREHRAGRRPLDPEHVHLAMLAELIEEEP